jgi:3'-5' exoribonuclease
MNTENIKNKIAQQAKCISEYVYLVCQEILEDKKFSYWSGSGKHNQHHYGSGGLIDHVSEVIDLCLMTKNYYASEYDIDEAELFLAAFFHDVGKLWDYQNPYYNENYPTQHYNEQWIATDHKRLIHHISRSGIVWSEQSKKVPEIYEKYHDKVLHAILSHHMAREYGSPVAPKTRVAWILTLCDNLSARMNDADKWDVIGGNK